MCTFPCKWIFHEEWISVSTYFIKIIAKLTAGWFVLEYKYHFSRRSSAYFAYSKSFLFQWNFKIYLGFFEQGTTFKTRVYSMKINFTHWSPRHILTKCLEGFHRSMRVWFSHQTTNWRNIYRLYNIINNRHWLRVVTSELGTLIPRTLCDNAEPLDGKRECTGVFRIEIQVWDLVESRCVLFSVI